MYLTFNYIKSYENREWMILFHLPHKIILVVFRRMIYVVHCRTNCSKCNFATELQSLFATFVAKLKIK